MSDTWKGMLALAAAVVVGAGATTTVATFSGLPQAVRSMEVTLEEHTDRLESLEDVFRMHTCLQVAEQDDGVFWEDCIDAETRARLRRTGR
jgi:hypothetical protein